MRKGKGMRMQTKTAAQAAQLAALLDSPSPESIDPELTRLVGAAALLRPRPGLSRPSWRAETKDRALAAFDMQFADAPAEPTPDAGSRDQGVETHVSMLSVGGTIARVADVEEVSPRRAREVARQL